jgi:hypothetical protein
MPVCERDPWREQYFAGVPCPEDVRIPTDDPDAYAWYPAWNGIYDKLHVARSQGMAAGDAASPPTRFPVFVKPRYSMKGMSMDAHRAGDAAAFSRLCRDGAIWQQFCEGDHVSTDFAVVDGRVVWLRHATGLPTHSGMFDHWRIHADGLPGLGERLAAWVEAELPGYSGLANTESIGGRIIEAHLRFADQWPDLYGPGFVEAAIGLYCGQGWSFPAEARRDGFSTPLFLAKGPRFRHPPASLQRDIRALPGVSSLQITFHEDRDPAAHPMPAGGFRVAIVNSWTRRAGRDAIAALWREWFAREGEAVSDVSGGEPIARNAPEDDR